MSNTTRNYLKDFDYRAFPHTASASQLDTFLTCPRKWWFAKVARLPELMNQAQFVFGDRLHEACERFLLGDETGRDPKTGEPIDLWPDGWDEGLDDFDASILRRLVEKGIDEGILRRTPGRVIEAPVGVWNGRNYTPRQIVPGVGVCGYRDVSYPGVVEDHKSSKSRRYLKSAADLLADPQLLLYAAIDIIEQVEKGQPAPAAVTLRHNQFVKDAEDLHVRATEVDVPSEVVQEFWETQIEPAAAEMLRYKRQKLPSEKWREVEGPRKKGACTMFGGCPFAKICGGVETPEGYCARIKRIEAMPTEEETTTTAKENDNMGIFDRTDKKTAKVKHDEAPRQKAAEIATVDETPKGGGVALVEPAAVPPWANPECVACSGGGFNAKAKPCPACDRTAQKEGKPTSSDYLLAIDDEGFTTWTSIETSELVGRRLLTVPEISATEKTKPATEAVTARGERKRKSRLKSDEPAPAEVAADLVDDVVIEPEFAPPPPVDVKPAAIEAAPVKVEPKAKATEVPFKTKRGAGFTVVYGAVRRSQMKLMDLNAMFARYAQELADAAGAESYFHMDRFKRRDLMASMAKEIAQTIPSSSIVTVRADDPDIRAFATAIEVFASNVIEGVS